MLGNPSVPLFISEGARKADAAASIGLCCTSVLGVMFGMASLVDVGYGMVQVHVDQGRQAPRRGCQELGEIDGSSSTGRGGTDA